MKHLRFLPNALTLSRILLCPIIITLLFKNQFLLSFVLYALGALTDFFDGFLARRLNAKTHLGSLLDPIADKILGILFYTSLMILGACPSWFLGMVLAVTVLQTIGFLLFHFGKPSSQSAFAPLPLGKWNTAFQLLWIGALLLLFALQNRIVPLGFTSLVLYLFLSLSQIAVFLSYFFHYRIHLSPEIRTVFPLRG